MSKPELSLASELTRSPSHHLNLEKDKHHAVERSLLRSVFIVVACTAVLVVNASNSTSVSISLPTIERDLDIDEAQLQWVVSAYSLSSACLLLFFGRLADLYGRKRAFVIGNVWLVALSLGCGFAQNGLILAVLRAFQGVGGAVTIPSAEVFIQARSIAFATFAAGAPVGGAFGGAIGAVLVEFSPTHWRSVFYLTAGISALTGITGMISFDADVPSTEIVERVDWIGASLVTIGLVLIVFVLGQGELASQGWKTPYIIVLLIAGVIMVSLFLHWERHLEQVQDDPSRTPSAWTPPPLMRPSTWTRAKGRMAVILAIAFLEWSGFMSWLFWMQACRLHSTLSGLVLSELLVTHTDTKYGPANSNAHFRLFVWTPHEECITCEANSSSTSAGVLFALIDPSATYWSFCFPSAVLVVFGADFVYSSGTLFIAKHALPHEHSVAGALFQTMTQSVDLGVTVNSAGTNVPRSAQLAGYRSAQWTSASLALMAALLAGLFLRSVGIVGDKKIIEHTDSDQTKTVQPELNGAKTPSTSSSADIIT
ncbi:major facilitator superfamily domain-containing protein [Suillus paluster]|uniref:major facilitator superfamily domain-containing protein n=1 Tax=Suillus paluster TaxID=48578 RepID=UPI001B882D2A|nr:major facilitator superfamily domain-containing protein [Suillus paluster]KAG1737059.1 major facilitator superfamily domain-containing protein [Suillus paluster]